VPVPFPPARVCGIDIDPFFNANTPQELGQLRAMLAKSAP
jgi:molybdopterin-guanine dinucleotide biosynthesis protein A